MRKVIRAALKEDWVPQQESFFCPPVDLIVPTLRHMQKERLNGVLLLPEWGGATRMPMVRTLGGSSFVSESGMGASCGQAGEMCRRDGS